MQLTSVSGLICTVWPYWQNTIFPLLTSPPYRRDVQSPRITTAFVLLMCTHPQAQPEERTGNGFASEVPALFDAASQSVSLGGVFNCVLHPTGTTGTFITSRALSEIVRGFALSGDWRQGPSAPHLRTIHPPVPQGSTASI